MQFRVVPAVAAIALATASHAASAVPASPDTPFKLATFETAGKSRIGFVLDAGPTIYDIAAANTYLVQKAHVTAMKLPADMRTLIEDYSSVASRLYQLANFLKAQPNSARLPFAYDIKSVTIEAPIQYPWNLLNLAANYKAHAEGAARASQGPPRGGFNAAAASQIDPDRDGPVVFAKSPRSCIIGTNEAFLIPPGRTKIDWEGELAIVMGKPAHQVSKANAHDYVFGYSILYDVSDRGGGPPRRVVSMFPGVNWFDGKSIDRGAPFGPFIVPKEFLPNFANLHLVTRVNGVIKQDARTSEMIWDEAHMIQFISSIMTLYPGDLISTGTPAGTGMERNEFLKPGDVVEIEIEGIGTLRTSIDNGRM